MIEEKKSMMQIRDKSVISHTINSTKAENSRCKNIETQDTKAKKRIVSIQIKQITKHTSKDRLRNQAIKWQVKRNKKREAKICDNQNKQNRDLEKYNKIKTIM
jgi:hypothetical protein